MNRHKHRALVILAIGLHFHQGVTVGTGDLPVLKTLWQHTDFQDPAALTEGKGRPGIVAEGDILKVVGYADTQRIVTTKRLLITRHIIPIYRYCSSGSELTCWLF